MTVERPDPAYEADERTGLNDWLDYHRATLEWKCEGLTVEQLRKRAVPPSTMSLLGLVRHMAEVERNWFRRCLAGEDAPGIYYSKSDPDGDFDNVDDADVDEAFATWHAECESARAIAAAHSLDDTGPHDDEQISLRHLLALPWREGGDLRDAYTPSFNLIGAGESPSGIFGSPHIANVLAAIKTAPELKDIKPKTTAEPCAEPVPETPTWFGDVDGRWLIGADTAARIVAPRFYEHDVGKMTAALERMRGLGCRFLVAGRIEANGRFVGCESLELPEAFRDLTLPKFRDGGLLSYLIDGKEKGILGTPGEILVGRPLDIKDLEKNG